MKVEDNRKKNTVKFEELDVGEVFISNNFVYIKTLDVKWSGFIYNAFNANFGSLSLFQNHDSVKQVKAKLVIED